MIGEYPAVSNSQARQARDAAKVQLAREIDPNDAKQEGKRIRIEAKGNYETAHRLRARIGSVFRDAVVSDLANHMSQQGDHVIINDGTDNSVHLLNVDINDLMDGNDFIF